MALEPSESAGVVVGVPFWSVIDRLSDELPVAVMLRRPSSVTLAVATPEVLIESITSWTVSLAGVAPTV